MSDIVVRSVRSELPGWFDPTQPNFSPPSDWSGARVRVPVPVGADPDRDLSKARVRLQKRYPGAELVLIPEFQQSDTPDNIDTTGTDEQLLRRYFAKQDLPQGILASQVIQYLMQFLPAISLFGVQGLELISVRAENVLGFEDCFWDLTYRGLTLITGINKSLKGNRSNGAGKSGMMSLPFIGLFGKTFKGQVHDQWACRFNDKTARVQLNLKLSDGRTLEILRQRRPGLLRIHLDGNEVTMGKPEQTQQLIEHLTNLTWDVLTNAVYIGQRETGSVFGTDKERKELFSRLLGLDRFLAAQEKLRKTAAGIQREADSISTDLEATKASLAEAQNGLNEIREAVQSAPKVTPDSISLLEHEIKVLEKNILKADNRIAEKQKSLADTKHLDHIVNIITSANTRAGIHQAHLRDTGGIAGRCSRCGSMIDPNVISRYRRELEKMIDAENSIIDEHERIQAKIRIECQKVYQQISQDRAENDNRRRLVAKKTSELVRMNERQEAVKKLNRILEEREQRISLHSRNLDIHNLAYAATLQEKQFLDICIRAVGRDGLPAYLCSVIAPRLNAATYRYSQIFSGGGIGVQFEMSGGDIGVVVLNEHGGKSFRDQSAGEISMAGHIAAFAFRDVLVPLGILILDEPGEGLDAEGAAAFARGISELAPRFGSVYVITHNRHILDWIQPDRHLEVTKENGKATVNPV